MTPPRTKVYLPQIGGTMQVLQEVFPEFDFAFEPWVPQCCNGRCLKTSGPAPKKRDIPLFMLQSKAVISYFEPLVLDFRRHVLSRTPVAQSPLTRLFISRHEP